MTSNPTIIAEGHPNLPLSRIKELIQSTLEVESGELTELAISFVTPAEIQSLNLEHRGKDAATDVLAYPYDESFPQGKGGDILLCPDIAAKSTDATHSLSQELDLLLVHGLLHVL